MKQRVQHAAAPRSEVQDDVIVFYECLVGHRYSLQGVLTEHYETEERALWAAILGLEEGKKLVQAVAPHLTPETAENLYADAEQKQEQANRIRKVVDELKAYRLAER